MNREELLKEIILYTRNKGEGFFEQEWIVNWLMTNAKQYLYKLNWE